MTIGCEYSEVKIQLWIFGCEYSAVNIRLWIFGCEYSTVNIHLWIPIWEYLKWIPNWNLIFGLEYSAVNIQLDIFDVNILLKSRILISEYSNMWLVFYCDNISPSRLVSLYMSESLWWTPCAMLSLKRFAVIPEYIFIICVILRVRVGLCVRVYVSICHV